MDGGVDGRGGRPPQLLLLLLLLLLHVMHDGLLLHALPLLLLLCLLPHELHAEPDPRRHGGCRLPADRSGQGSEAGGPATCTGSWDFPGGPGLRTPSFRCRGPGFNPWSGNCVQSLHSCPTLCNPMDCTPPGSSVHGDSPGKHTGVGCHALLQGIFPTQGSNPGL